MPVIYIYIIGLARVGRRVFEGGGRSLGKDFGELWTCPEDIEVLVSGFHVFGEK